MGPAIAFWPKAQIGDDVVASGCANSYANVPAGRDVLGH